MKGQQWTRGMCQVFPPPTIAFFVLRKFVVLLEMSVIGARLSRWNLKCVFDRTLGQNLQVVWEPHAV